jgi:hypothetical protein
MAHFMGVGGAAKLISNAEDNPNATAANIFPNAAAANHSIFYDRSGNPRTVAGVYSVLTSRYDSAASSQTTRTTMASAGVTSASVALASATPVSATPASAPVDHAAYLSSFPDVRTVTPAAATSASSAYAAASPAPIDPTFRSLYQGGDRSAPVSPAVQELWGNSSSLTSAPLASSVPSVPPTQTSSVTAPQTSNVSVPQPLDLFSDRTGAFSS